MNTKLDSWLSFLMDDYFYHKDMNCLYVDEKIFPTEQLKQEESESKFSLNTLR